MADSVELRMSVVSIKRVDPYIKEILASSTHVALYEFNPVINEWEKTETEGALFLYSRTGEPWHSMMIMNRLNTDNLIEPIVKGFEYQLQPPFILYRNSRNKIFGIWFYNREECLNITCFFKHLMEGLRDKQLEKSKKKVTTGGVDIFSMLSKAQEDFNNKTPSKIEVQPKYSSTPRAPDIPSQSVMDFFAKAGTTNKIVKNVASPSGNGDNFIHKLMSNPAHSVEHIEKQQRAITPQDTLNQNKDVDSKSMPIFYSNSAVNLETKPLETLSDSFIHTSLPIQQNMSPISSLLLHSNSLNAEDRDVSTMSPLAKFLDTPSKPQLMPPMMFATSSLKEKENHLIQEAQDRGVDLLTSNQLQQALVYLLKNDNEFVTKLHEAYTKSVNEKLNCTKSVK